MTNNAKTTAMKNDGKKVLKPKLRFPEFREAEGWVERPIGGRLDLLSGYPFDGSDISQDSTGVRLLRGINITEGSIRHSTQIDRYYLGSKDGLDKFEIQANDLVIGMDGSKVGKNSALVTENDAGALLIQRVARLRTEDPTLIRFIFLHVNSPLFHRYVDRINTSSGIPHISAKQIRDFAIYFPVPAEQQQVAACVGALDELIAAQARKVDTLRTHKKGLMQQLFPSDGETRPRLRFPEFQNAGEWKIRKAGSLFGNRIAKGEEGIPIYSVTMHDGMVRRDSFERNFYDIENAAGNKKVCKNDIAYNMMRMWQGALGVAPEDCLVSPAYIVLAPLKGAVPDFFQYMFKLPETLLLLTSHSRGLTKDRLRLYYDDFARIPLRCPALTEQQRIADCLTALDDLIAAQTQTLNTLKTHKKGLMQQLFPSMEDT